MTTCGKDTRIQAYGQKQLPVLLVLWYNITVR